MDEDSVFTKRFITCVRKSRAERTSQDIDYICHTLKKLSEFSSYDSSALRSVPERLVYEQHNIDSILYSAGDSATCWYYVLRGSVMISLHYFFSTGSSFGQCTRTDVREHQCHVIEPSEILKIKYTKEELKRAIRMASRSQSTSSLERSTNQTQGESTREELVQSPREFTIKILSGHEAMAVSHTGSLKREMVWEKVKSGDNVSTSAPDIIRRRKKLSDERTDAFDLDMFDPLTNPGNGPMSAGDILERNRRSRSEERFFSFDQDDVKKLSMSNDSLNKAMEDPVQPEEPTSSEVNVRKRGKRDRERRYSAPPVSERQIRDSVGSIEYLSESQVDSDDEESVQSETSNSTSMDAILEVLSKAPTERTDEDIERVMDVLQYIPVFSNMTSNIRRALFQILMLISIDNENTVVIDNGEEVDRWYVVLNGHLKLLRDSEGEKIYHVGDSFGVSASLKKLPHRGRLVSATKDCTLCFVSTADYGRILTQGEENMKRVEENGHVVMVMEKRALDAKREGYFIVQATPEHLLDHLLEETVDDTFHKDFLLTYRTFLPSAEPIIEKLKSAWLSALPETRERITMIMLNWVTEHFPDFEGHDLMIEFLDWFEARLVEDGKVGEKRALDKARSLHARTRYIEMDRAGTNSPLDFNVVGGWEVVNPIFVSKVEPHSIPDRAGLRVGDQILEINDTKCDKKELREVLSILRKNFKLSLKVRSNLPEFKQFMADPPKPPPDYQRSKSPAPHPLPAHISLGRCNSDSVDGSPGLRPRAYSEHASARKTGSPKTKRKVPKIFKPLTGVGKSQLEKLKKLRLSHRNHSNSFISSNGSDSVDTISVPGPLKAKGKMPARKSAENLVDYDKPRGPMRASSLEEIHTIGRQSNGTGTGTGTGTLAARIVDAVVKLYQPDHSYKYIDMSPSTTVAELISRGVKEFYPEKFVVSPADEYCLCLVTVQSRNGPIRNSVLPNHMTDLANFIGLESRYYLKERAFHGTLVQDEEAEHIFRESRQWEHILNLSPKQMAEEITRGDSEVFCSIDSSEYISDLWRNPDHLTKENLSKFEDIPNDEMYWVVTTVVSETRSDMRAKMIKQFIKVSKWCKELKNYNTMFHLLSGLNHGLVHRQRSTWEKVPTKYRKTVEDLSGFMNPFHNMAKYRELQRSTTPPLIPLFPIIKKDLTFLYDGNETWVEGLVNFEKLRMLSRQISVVKAFCQQTIMPEPPQVDLGQLGVLKSIHHSIRMRNRGPGALSTLTDNALKKVYHHHRMMKMVKKHLSRKYVIQDEDLLEKIAESNERMVQLRKNPPSPLNRGKRKEKHKSATMSISPSHTTGSFGSDSSAPTVVDTLATPPLSPRKNSAPSNISGLVASTQQDNGTTPPRSPSLHSYGSINGSAHCPK